MVEILLTNDDGIGSAGILALADSLTRLGQVTVVAPDRERSATSQALTLSRPIRYQELSSGKYSVDGTPTDCIIFALHYLLKVKPDLVVSGINHGPNLGRDIGYSGTVAGAIEGSNHDIPSFAISLAAGFDNGFRTAAEFAAILAEKLLTASLSTEVVFNVNVPGGNIQGARITFQGRRNIRNIIVENHDPRGRKYFWLDQDLSLPNREEDPAADYVAVSQGFISVTPIRTDRTGYDIAEKIADWPKVLFKLK